MENHTIIVKSQKNPGTAAILGLFFGPLGMLYATLTGAIIMFVVTALALLFTFGFGLFITNPICAIWAYTKVKNENDAENRTVANQRVGAPSHSLKEKKDTDNLFD